MSSTSMLAIAVITEGTTIRPDKWPPIRPLTPRFGYASDSYKATCGILRKKRARNAYRSTHSKSRALIIVTKISHLKDKVFGESPPRV